jgi:hypothetical protein
MGLLIQTSFETPEGIPITNIYSKLTEVVCTLLSRTEARLLIKHETFISREKRLGGARSLKTPGVPDYVVVTVSPTTDAWGNMEFLYTTLKTELETQGFTVEDVIEPEPAPEPAPEPEPTPES